MGSGVAGSAAAAAGWVGSAVAGPVGSAAVTCPCHACSWAPHGPAQRTCDPPSTARTHTCPRRTRRAPSSPPDTSACCTRHRSTQGSIRSGARARARVGALPARPSATVLLRRNAHGRGSRVGTYHRPCRRRRTPPARARSPPRGSGPQHGSCRLGARIRHQTIQGRKRTARRDSSRGPSSRGHRPSHCNRDPTSLRDRGGEMHGERGGLISSGGGQHRRQREGTL